MDTLVKPQYPIGAAAWFNLPRNQLEPEQLEAVRKYAREYVKYKRATDPEAKERFRATKRLSYNRNIYNNREKINAYNRAWCKANPDKVRETARRPNRRIQSRLHGRVYSAIKRQGTIKSKSTTDLLGCSVDELKSHLEKQFLPWMTWENYGPLWHIDHIKPCSSFNLLDPAEQLECFHFTNLQPLEAKENIRKYNKLNWQNEHTCQPVMFS